MVKSRGVTLKILIIIIIVVLPIHIIITLSQISSDDKKVITDLQENQRLKKATDYALDDRLINSPYYVRYETAFDLIRYNGCRPQYKIDWLMESLDKERDLEVKGHYVVKSIEF